MRTVLGITGASGAAFALDFLRRCPGDVWAVASRWGRAVLQEECGVSARALEETGVRLLADSDLAAPFSSGGNHFDAMVVLPCSASTMAKIACGIGDTLLTRTAHVALKERRRLVLCLRETPLTLIALENAMKVTQAGAIVMPVMPAMYLKPTGVADLVSGFVDRVLALLGVEPPPAHRWRAAALPGDVQ
jgi:4-hydroxy-3-polyprenylbenzoate decarboxylase